MGAVDKYNVTIVLLGVSILQPIVSGGNLSKVGQKGGRCNLYQGRWIFDDSYPPYNSIDCPFIEQVFNCQKNGRPDRMYLKYRWQPNACNSPRFSGIKFLERLRGKRILFVGDSLSLNQWQSLTCLVHKAVPQASYTLSRTEGLSTFRFNAYDVSILLSRNALLVDVVNDKMGRVLMLNSIKSGKTWMGSDILVFNSWHWWLHNGRQLPWDFIQDGSRTYKDMNRLLAFEKGLKTWARWIDSNINPNKTKVFFQDISPDHANASAWGDRKFKDCRGQQKPLVQPPYLGGPHPAEAVVRRVLRSMSTPVRLLKITSLSQLRKDGHPSIYGFGGRHASDCSHWCLPGVPDTWNQLLYAALVRN